MQRSISNPQLYVAHTSNDSVDVIDCHQDKYLRSIPNLAGVAGVLVSNENDLVFTSNRGENTVGVFNQGKEKNLHKIKVGGSPNGLAFDPSRNSLLAAQCTKAEQPRRDHSVDRRHRAANNDSRCDRPWTSKMDCLRSRYRKVLRGHH
jgi:YVTN family beta-propeller protein